MAKKELEYGEIMALRRERGNVKDLPRVWNSLDVLTDETKMLHTTGRLTQPWKTGLPIDFTRNPMPKILGVIPREPIHRLLGKYHSTYQPHPDRKIDAFFIALLKDALAAGAVSRAEVESEIRAKHVRPDLLELAG